MHRVARCCACSLSTRRMQLPGLVATRDLWHETFDFSKPVGVSAFLFLLSCMDLRFSEWVRCAVCYWLMMLIVVIKIIEQFALIQQYLWTRIIKMQLCCNAIMQFGWTARVAWLRRHRRSSWGVWHCGGWAGVMTMVLRICLRTDTNG